MASSSAPVLAHGYSCVSCKKRKSRCNRQLPCSNCVQMSIECVPGTRASYPARRRPRKQAQRQSPAVETQTADPEEVEHAPAFGQKFAQNLWHGLGHEVGFIWAVMGIVNWESSSPESRLMGRPRAMMNHVPVTA